MSKVIVSGQCAPNQTDIILTDGRFDPIASDTITLYDVIKRLFHYDVTRPSVSKSYTPASYIGINSNIDILQSEIRWTTAEQK